MDHTDERTPLITGSGLESQPTASDTYLSRFQQALGINATTSSHNDLESARRSTTGIYKEIISARLWRRRQYIFVEVVYYLALLANIVIGATLASLGPSSELHPRAITILGIVNSSTAGILALLKGQGLPGRLGKDEFEMRTVQDFIEETEAMLASGTLEDMTEKKLDDLVKEAVHRYNVARDTTQMNKPDNYVHQVDDRQVDNRPVGGGSGEQETGGEGQGAVGAGSETGGEGQGSVGAGSGHQVKLSLDSRKGKALVIS